jgi:hypothetical protein
MYQEKGKRSFPALADSRLTEKEILYLFNFRKLGTQLFRNGWTNQTGQCSPSTLTHWHFWEARSDPAGYPIAEQSVPAFSPIFLLPMQPPDYWQRLSSSLAAHTPAERT